MVTVMQRVLCVRRTRLIWTLRLCITSICTIAEDSNKFGFYDRPDGELYVTILQPRKLYLKDGMVRC